jgi:endonuclease YncB( thermonuclease family)
MKRFMFVLLLVAVPCHAQESFTPLAFERAIDGDTMVASGKTIRLWGIDTPEKDMPLYAEARSKLEAVAKEDLSCRFVYKDAYQRDVMHCFANSVDIGSLMVFSGMAKDHKKYSAGYYQSEQKAAKEARKGIWK